MGKTLRNNSDGPSQELYDLIIQANKEQTAELRKDIKSCEENLTSQLKKNISKVKKLENRCLYLERKVRKNNIVIFGTDFENDNLVQLTISKLNELLGLQLTTDDINNIYKIGQSPKPPVVVEFISYLKKTQVFKYPERLRALKGTNISITNDLCEKDRDDQKILRHHLKLARSKKQEAKIKGNRLEIDKKLYTAEELMSDCDQLDASDSESEQENEVDGLLEHAETSKEVRKKRFERPYPVKCDKDMKTLRRK